MPIFIVMIQKANEHFFIALDKTHTRKLMLHNGETVTAKIIRKESETTARIYIRGFLFTAKTPAALKAGQVFKMHVQVQNNQLVLVPLLPNIDNAKTDFNYELSQYRNRELAEVLVKNFVELNAVPDFSVITKLYTTIEAVLQKRIALNKSTNEQKQKLLIKRLSFLMTCFHDKKIPLTPTQLEQIYSGVFELPDKDETLHSQNNQEVNKTEAELIADEYILQSNHLKGSGAFHWMLFPFEKKSVSKTLAFGRDFRIKGLAGFLLNMQTQRCIKTVIRASVRDYAFLLELENGVCTLSSEGDETISEAEKYRLISLLQAEMNARNVDCACNFGQARPQLKELDIRV